ncbi:MAG: peptide chain release factor N(5)-glutamine methyltransferase [Alphaproteobacteria bacterium]|nr:peptide chain release factor N(5)-glutamine methyltransferase [Alphaproteobacteria bacterium]
MNFNEAAAVLAAAGIDEPRREARILERNAADAATFAKYIERRAAREPVAYILGRKEFWSLEFEVSPAVLIPRPESETLVETALKYFKEKPPRTILDLGTGSACLLIALLSEWRSATGLGLDISPQAIEIARRNAARHLQGARAVFRVNDWAQGLGERFDLIVSNPPYITARELLSLDRDVIGFEPKGALDGGEDGLDPLRRIAADLRTVMQPEGLAVIELGIDQAASASRILVNSGLEVLHIAKDLGGRDRAIVARVPHRTLA